MADGPMNRTETDILRHMAQDTGDETLNTPEDGEGFRPAYKMVGDSKLPTSKHHGPLWRSRKDAALNKLSSTGKIDNWDEAIRYYKNDQRKGRSGTAARTRSQRLSKDSDGYDSENIVFANTSALVPAIYAKNPVCELTPNVRDDNQPDGPDDALKALSTTAERLANALASRKEGPGINLKPKARKAVVMTTLTNIAYIEVGYTKKEEASETALVTLQQLTQKLAAAKDQKEIMEVEGNLIALEESMDFLLPSGPWAKFRHPKDVLRDPDANGGIEDCKYVMISEFISTEYINAVYREKKPGSEDEWTSIYKPTHVVNAGGNGGIDDEINNFSLFQDGLDYKQFGYNDNETYKKGCRTKVWKVWDKITRRIYMYNDGDWSWPIWVWDDPYNLEGFFPIFPMEFYTDPEDDIGNSEVMYYLDQQDAINQINSELHKVRQRIMGTIFYNKNVIKDITTVEAYLSGQESKTAIGIDAPPDADMNKAFFAMLPPSAQFIQLLDKETYFAAAARVSSVQPVMQGQQFKTNTTNDAIETYNSTQQTRLDEKIDAVEECIGNVLWAVIQLCLQFMPAEQVAEILGPNDAQHWQQMDAKQIRSTFSVRVVGGSTQKPTSRIKKQEAIQMGQTLGQFASTMGAPVVLLILKVMERAFDELTITTEDWQMLQMMVMQSMQQGQEQQQQPQEGEGDQMGQIVGMINSLPDAAKKALGDAMAKGAPIEEALPRIVQMIQQAQAGAEQ